MQLDQFYEFCLNLKGTTEHFPFDEDTLVFKVGDKIYALSSLSEWENGNPKVNLKCDLERAIELREAHSGIEPGFHKISAIERNPVPVGLSGLGCHLFIC